VEVATASIRAVIPVTADTTTAAAKLAALQKLSAEIRATLGAMAAKVDDTTAASKINGMLVRAGLLDRTLRGLSARVDTAGFEGGMLRATRDANALVTAMTKLKTEADKPLAGGGFLATFLKGPGGGAFGLGGTIGLVGTWHVLIDALAEGLIILSTSLLALGAAAAAVYPSVDQLGISLKATLDASTALGTDAGPLAGKLDALQKAMAPQVIEAYGGALALVTGQAGALNKAVPEVVGLFDTWIAKMDIWVGTQQQAGGLLHTGTGFLIQFGHVLGSVGQAIDNLITKDPGVAHFLLDIVGATAGLLNLLTRLPRWLVEAAIGLHGMWVWANVLGFALGKMLGPVTGLVTWVAKFGTAGTEAAGAAGVLGGALGKAGTAAKNFGLGLYALAASPVTWALVLAAGIAAVVYEMHQGTDAAKTFIGGMNDRLGQMKASDAIPAIITDLGQLDGKIRTAFGPANISAIQGTFGGNSLVSMGRFKANLISMGDAGVAWGHTMTDVLTGNVGRAFRDFGGVLSAFGAKHNAAVHQAGQDVQAYRGEITKLTGEQKNLYAETGLLIRAHYTLAQAWALMDLAGVKANDTLAVMEVKVKNLINGYDAMGISGALLKNSVDALSFATLQQDSKVTELNSAWDTFFKTVTGGEQAFTGFATQVEGLYQSLSNAGVKLTDSNGKVSLSTKLAGDAAQGGTVSMTGLNSASLQARDTFLRTADAAAQQMDSLRLLASAAGLGGHGTDLLTQANKDLVASMLPAARGSKAMTDILYALAQQGGYQGANSFRDLSRWVQEASGSVKAAHDPMANLDGIVTTLTTDAAGLTQDVKNLSLALGTTLNDAMAAAILQASGGQQVFDNFATAVLNTRVNSKQARDAAVPLAQAIYNMTGNAADAKREFETFATAGLGKTKAQADTLWQETFPKLKTSIDNLPTSKTITIEAIAEGKGGVKVFSQGLAAKEIMLSKLAGGGFVAAGSGPTADDVPAMLSRGEVVVPAHMVQAGAVDHLRGALPGFASGGQVGRQVAAFPGAVSDALAEGTKSLLADTLSAVLTDLKKQLIATGSGGAVLALAEKYLGTPYVWGGSDPSGWDCSGYVSWIYDHLGLFRGRSDAAGFQRWAKPSPPTPGGLAFYGMPAHHVGFVVNGSTLLSALGRKYGTIYSNLMMGDNSGYGIPPLGFGGGAPGGATPSGKIQELAFSLLAQYGWTAQWPQFSALENAEAGWSMTARNPSGAYGLAQFINGPSEYFQYGGDPNTALGQLTAMMNYIGQRWHDPAGAWANEAANHWYATGGAVGSAARRGPFTGGRWPPWKPPGGVIARQEDFWSMMGTTEAAEKAAYADVTAKFRGSLARPKAGTWEASHKSAIEADLALLGARQKAEEAAYTALRKTYPGHPGKAAMNALAAAAWAEAGPVKFPDLSRYPGGWPAEVFGLYQQLGGIHALAGRTVTDPSVPRGLFAAPGLPPRGTPRYDLLASIFGFDSGGWLPPGISLAANFTGQPERVLAPGAAGPAAPGATGTLTEQQGWLIIDLLRQLVSVGKANPAALSQSLNNVAATAASRGYYR
jgi:hypothetical protein